MLVFVYGTLADPDRAAAVLDEHAYDGTAVLRGLHRVTGEYATLAPGGETVGRLLRTPEVDRLDAYEGVESGLYRRVTVPLSGQRAGAVDADEVAVYVGDPDRLDAPAEWPGTGDFGDRVRAYLAAHDVRVERGTPGADRQD